MLSNITTISRRCRIVRWLSLGQQSRSNIMCFQLFIQTLPKAGPLTVCFSASSKLPKDLQRPPFPLEHCLPFKHPGLLGTSVPNQTIDYGTVVRPIRPRPGNAVLCRCSQDLARKRCVLRSEALCLEILSSHIILLMHRTKRSLCVRYNRLVTSTI